MDNYIGIDIAKATLQVYIPKNDTNIEIKNSSDGLKKLYSKLKNNIKNLLMILYLYMNQQEVIQLF